MPTVELQDIAAFIADGIDVDWTSAEANAAPDRQAVVRALADVATLVEGHRSWQLERRSGLQVNAPSSFGHLRVLGPLGRGGFGDVLRAYDPHLEREVALKLLTPGVTDSGSTILHEGRLLARVKHPHVVTVFGAAEHEGQVGLWMELLDGRDLRELVELQGPLSPKEATLIGIDLCGAIAAVHRQSIVHGDVKAQNVMREEGGRIVLTDFGIGRDLQAGGSAPTAPAGTPLYLAPEQLEGEGATVSSDVYSLGVLLFYLVTGEHPAQAGSWEELEEAHRSGQLRLLRDLRPNLPEPFLAAVEKALEPALGDRYATPGQMERALRTSLGVAGPWEAMGRRRKPLSALLVALAVLFALWPRESAEEITTSSEEARQRYYEAGERYPERIDEALALLETANEIDPNFAMSYHRRALYNDALGRYSQALEASEAAFRLRDQVTETESYTIQGTYYLYRMQYEKALALFMRSKVLDEDRVRTDALRQIALIQANLGRPDQAVVAAREAVVADPHDPLARGL